MNFKNYKIEIIMLMIFVFSCSSFSKKDITKINVVSFNEFIMNRNDFYKERIILKDTFFHSINLNYTVQAGSEKCYVMLISKMQKTKNKSVKFPLYFDPPENMLLVYVPIYNKKLLYKIIDLKPGDKFIKILGIGVFPESTIVGSITNEIAGYIMYKPYIKADEIKIEANN